MDKRPNFLIFITEQHRGDCLGIDGHPVLLTPNMDSIGGAGVRFTACHTSVPTCIGARRCFRFQGCSARPAIIPAGWGGIITSSPNGSDTASTTW